MTTDRLRIAVTGLVGQYPLGGVAWDYLQYAMGLRELGHDVIYLEDSGMWPYDPKSDGLCEDPAPNIVYLTRLMDRIGFQERWAYRLCGGTWFGMSDSARTGFFESMDL